MTIGSAVDHQPPLEDEIDPVHSPSADPPDTRPLVLLDVDGVIHDIEMLIAVRILDAASADRFELDLVTSHGHRLAIPRYMPDLVLSLAAECEVWWCTTWRQRANDDIATHLGVQPFPVIDDGTLAAGTTWKASAAKPIVTKARQVGRPVVWIEDFHGDYPDLDGVAFVDTGPHGCLRWTDLDIPELLGSQAGNE